MGSRAAILALTTSTLVGCSLTNASFQWRQVSIAGRAQCLPVAFSADAQQQGLQGVKRVVRPMVFAYSPPSAPSFWMEDTPRPLSGVWVGAAGTVIGYWHGRPGSSELHTASEPISAVIEYPAGAQVPAAGSPIAIGRPCETKDRGL